MSLRDVDDLAGGSVGQQRALAEWCALDLADRLGRFDPVLVSTLVSDLDLPTSDLDVACDASDPGFRDAVRGAYGARPGFAMWSSGDRIVAAFDGPTLRVEVFGEPRPVEQQNAYLHALAARRLVTLGGEAFSEAVRTVRIEHGLKTEPAIARVLNLVGDPYVAVRQLASAPDAVLRTHLRGLDDHARPPWRRANRATLVAGTARRALR